MPPDYRNGYPTDRRQIERSHKILLLFGLGIDAGEVSQVKVPNAIAHDVIS
jgi:hypothetical protein